MEILVVVSQLAHTLQERVLVVVPVHHVKDSAQESDIVATEPAFSKLVIGNGYTAVLNGR